MKLTINQLPQTQEELTELINEYSQTPERATVLFILALNIISKNLSQTADILKLINPDVSTSMIQLTERQLKKNPYTIRSYFSGTTPENNYTIPTNPEIELSTNKYSGSIEDGKIKYFIKCSGADSARPITLKKSSNQNWYVHEFSSLIVGIRKPIN